MYYTNNCRSWIRSREGNISDVEVVVLDTTDDERSSDVAVSRSSSIQRLTTNHDVSDDVSIYDYPVDSPMSSSDLSTDISQSDISDDEATFMFLNVRKEKMQLQHDIKIIPSKAIKAPMQHCTVSLPLTFNELKNRFHDDDDEAEQQQERFVLQCLISPVKCIDRSLSNAGRMRSNSDSGTCIRPAGTLSEIKSVDSHYSTNSTTFSICNGSVITTELQQLNDADLADSPVNLDVSLLSNISFDLDATAADELLSACVDNVIVDEQICANEQATYLLLEQRAKLSTVLSVDEIYCNPMASVALCALDNNRSEVSLPGNIELQSASYFSIAEKPLSKTEIQNAVTLPSCAVKTVDSKNTVSFFSLNEYEHQSISLPLPATNDMLSDTNSLNNYIVYPSNLPCSDTGIVANFSASNPINSSIPELALHSTNLKRTASESNECDDNVDCESKRLHLDESVPSNCLSFNETIPELNGYLNSLIGDAAEDNDTATEIESDMILADEQKEFCLHLDEQQQCFRCLIEFKFSALIHCFANHGICRSCLSTQVKNLLTTTTKTLFGCEFLDCGNFYCRSQLKESLPAMVFDILEEKLELEYNASASRMLEQINGEEEEDDVGDGKRNKSVGRVLTKSPEKPENIHADFIINIPIDNNNAEDERKAILEETVLNHDHFEVSSDDNYLDVDFSQEGYRLIEVLANSLEFERISDMFHETMDRNTADIVKLERLHNPTLYEFYAVKKKQIAIEISNSNDPYFDGSKLEKSLFHGVQKSFIETICRNNFDWRTCGVSHGIMYGQGTYFARDACYAHRYTDRSPKKKQPPSVIQPTDKRNVACLSTSHPCLEKDCKQDPELKIGEDKITKSMSFTFKTAALSSEPQILSNHHVSTSSIDAIMSPEKLEIHDTNALSDLHVDSDTKTLTINETKPCSTPDANSCTPYQHIRHMFVARVLVGSYVEGRLSYRKPPPIDPDAPYGRLFNSCVNYLDDPSLFVIFDAAQYYPEYLIHYINKPAIADL